MKQAKLALMTTLLAIILVACAPAPTVLEPTQDASPILTEIADALNQQQPESAPTHEPSPTPQIVEATPPAGETIATTTPTEESSPTATATATPSATAGPVAATGFRVVLEDDFSSTLWYTSEEDKYSFRYKDKGYAIEINILNAWIWSIRSDNTLTDVRLEVDARHHNGPKNGYYGVFCRFVDDDNYYALTVSEEGGYVIAKRKDGEFEFLAQGKDENNIIKTDGTANRVMGECLGSRLRLTVNGTQLLQVEDSDFASGASGAIAASRLEPGFEALFTYYRLSVPGNP